MLKKIISSSLAIFLFSAINFCSVECAFAGSENQASEKVKEASCHEKCSTDEGRDGANSKKHDAETVCCSSLVASQISYSNFSNIQLQKNGTLSSFRFLAQPFFVSAIIRSEYQDKSPPGNLFPSVFLSANFTHAPPAIL